VGDLAAREITRPRVEERRIASVLDPLQRWRELGLPDKPDAEVAAYVERLAGKLNALV